MKAQVSIYIIIAIVILIIIGIFSYTKFRPDVEVKNPDTLDFVRDHIQNCLDTNSDSALNILGQQGSLAPKNYMASKDVKISYYYFKGQNFLPLQNQFEQELEKYVSQGVRGCVNEFYSNKFVIDPTETLVDVNLDDGVKFVLVSPIKVYYEGKEENVTGIDYETDIQIKHIYEVASKIIIDTWQTPDWINLDNLKDESLIIKMVKIDKETLVYVITDGDYEFKFAVRYDL